MGFFDLFRKNKTDDERDLEEATRKSKSEQISAPVPSMSLEDTKQVVIKMLAENSKIQAIKFVKDNTGVGLKEAKDFVESIERTCVIDYQSVQQRQNSQFANFISPDLEQKVRNLLAQGQKMEAIKLVKDSTDLGLKECKEYVESL